MPRFIPIIIEVQDSKATPRVKGLKNAFDDLEKSETKASGGFKNVFESINRLGTQSIQKVVSTVKQLGDTAVRTSSETRKSFKEIESQAEATARGSSSAFSQYFSAAFFASLLQNILTRFIQFGKDFVGKSVELASDAKNALLGVESVSLFKGIDPNEARKALNDLDLVKHGIISVADASVSLKNLLQSGFGLDKSITLIQRFGDTAAFGKQAALSYGEAIRSATEGIKNQNSILVDNAGISKNIEVILKERGFHMQDLSDKVKGLAAREALYNGLLAESAGQLGDAAKLTETYTGVVAAQDKAFQDLQRSIGEIIITNPALIESNKIVTEQFNDATAAIQRQDSESAKFVKNAIYYYAQFKAQLAPFGAFVVNAAKSIFSGLVVLDLAFKGTIFKAAETLINGINKAIETVLNLLIAGINKITDTARKLPSDGFGPIAALQAVQPIAPVQAPRVPDFSKELFDQMSKWLDTFKRANEAMGKASDEGVEIGRRIYNRYQDAEFMANLPGSPSAADRRVQRAQELADGSHTGGGSGNKVADDFKSIANVIPVPTPGDPQLKAMIEDYADTFGIPLWVAFSQIWTESRFNKNALSIKKAKGLTQITPATAATYNISYKNLNDPAVALSGWGKIMSSLYTKYGSWDLALLAYHQGEKPVDKLVQIIQSGQVDEKTGGFAGAARRAGIGPAGRKYLEDINVFKSNPLREQESSFVGMRPQEIVKAVLTTDMQGRPRPIQTDEAPLAQLPITLERQWDKYFEGVEQGEKALNERRQDLGAEYLANARALTTELGNLELDLSQIRRENADDQMTEQRRLLAARGEEKDLLLSIRKVEDELANGPYNQSLRIQLALLEDIADIRRRDEDAIKAQHRAQLELADGEVFHTEQARAKVLDHLARSRTETDVFADAIIDAYEGINDAVLHGVERITGGVKILDNLIAGLITRLTDRLFQKLLDILLPSGQGSQGRGAGGILNLFGRGGGGSGSLIQIGAGGSGASGGGIGGIAQLLGGGGLLAAGGMLSPTSLTSQLTQQQALSTVIHEAGHSAAGTAAGAFVPQSTGLLSSLGAALPLLGAGIGVNAGGQSLVGQILGGAGGLIAGGIGAAFLAPGLFAASGVFGSMGPLLAGLLTNPITAIAAGALLIGAFAFSKNAARRRDERSRNQSMVDSLGQLNQILAAVKSDRMDGGQAIAAAVQIRAQYLSTMGELKDKKTREIALKDVSRLDVIINQIRNEANAQLNRQEIDRKLVPEFATGMERGLVPNMGHQRTLIKVRPGERIDDVGLAQSFFVPGIDRGVDSVFTVATPGSRVLTKPQQARIPSYANGTPAALPSAESDRPISFTVNINLPGMKLGVLAEQIVKSPEGREAIVKLVQIENRDGRFN